MNRPAPAKDKPGTPDPRAGTTLVEVLVGALILAVLAVGTAGYLYHARSETAQGGDLRLSLEVANTRLEELRMADYHAIKPPTDDYNIHYLAKLGTNWNHNATDPGEMVVMDARDFSIVTTVQYLDLDGGLSSYDYIAIMARAVHAADPARRVVLETYAYAP